MSLAREDNHTGTDESNLTMQRQEYMKMLMAGEEAEDRKEIRTYLFRNNIS